MTEPDFDKAASASELSRPAPAGNQAMGAPDMVIARSTHLRDYLKILYKRRWLVIAVAVPVALISIVQAYTAVSVYGATVKLLIEAEAPRFTEFANAGDGGEWSDDALGTQYDLLKSRRLARRTLNELKLWDNMPPKDEPEAFNFMGTVTNLAMRPVQWVGGLLTTATPPASESAEEDETAEQSDAIDALLGMLTVTPVDDSRLVNLTAQSFDPKLATAVVNMHARGYIEQDTEFKFQSSEEATKWLNDRLVEQRKAVDAAEKTLQQYRETHTTIPPEDSQNITVQKLSQLSEAYTAARLARLDKEVVFNQLSAIGNNEAALDAFPAILSNVAIQAQRSELATLKRNEEELLATFDINHPRVKTLRSSIESAEAKIRVERQNVVKAVRTDFEASKAQEANLEAALQAQKAEALTMSQESIQFGMLKREVDSTREIFQSLLQSAKETGISTQQRTTNVRIVDLAELPRGPMSPNRSLNMMMGLFSGLFVGVLLAFGLEYFDDRIKNPEELKAHLGLPMLGLLPVVRGLKDDQYPLVSRTADHKLAESVRTLRTNVIFSFAEEGCRTLVVTSTGPNEGKTMVAANFAIALAEAGQRVLIIDGDLRRPQQHKVFEVESEPGVSNLIVGGVKPSEVIRKTSLSGLWILPAGRVPPNPAELLGSKRFLEYLQSFAKHFDWIVVDTPPVMAVSDASAVAHAATGVLLVVRADAVSRPAAQAAIEQLDNTRANIIGAVLNQVDLDRHGYYYSQYYRKEYSAYYAAAPRT